MVNSTVLGVLVSGRGSNLQAILDAINAGKINAKISVVISDKADTFALKRVAGLGIATAVIERKAFASKDQFEAALVAELKDHKVELVVLAGFMRLLGNKFISAYPGRVMNIHPALLPAFPGLNAQQQALDYGVKLSGCTVHFVDEGMDSGPIILQQAVPVESSDTEETLAARILEVEHILYPRAISLFCQRRLSLKNRQVVITDEKSE
ncbi:MAG: purN [Firmicutes bacterium]|nr:purN [Bacillota bacterium]